MLLVQNRPFFQLFFLGIVSQENMFYDILEPTNTFLGYKNEKFKKSKNWHFSKGLTHAFGPKMAIFPTFFLRQYRPRKCHLPYSRTKKHLSRPEKHKVQKSRKIDIFPKGLTHAFNPKMAIYPTFFFQAIYARKMSFTIF